ncbi:hypothetical protein, partial [Sphingobacterium siyangense]|uniref:hypothetical protein n=1 Tax=Sphingobacterium siyangense TaxID=459529 RepID=UPI002FD93C57
FYTEALAGNSQGLLSFRYSPAVTLPPLTITAYPLHIVYRSTLKDSSYFIQELKVRYRYNTYRWEICPALLL